ncbi:hypothetical protein BpHYR1_023884 [Brachionus plicatilis]|uniref:Uncharacterized protein n=1 Tax=Brachionus plicatilis TaxID=10195 RepID=A0A3M7R7X6_BRAPC|nr:hypothetical protein BpHYR1_023884 [Brachionus plicatilis]
MPKHAIFESTQRFSRQSLLLDLPDKKRRRKNVLLTFELLHWGIHVSCSNSIKCFIKSSNSLPICSSCSKIASTYSGCATIWPTRCIPAFDKIVNFFGIKFNRYLNQNFDSYLNWKSMQSASPMTADSLFDLL